jgi:hypothetical protein
MMFGSDELYWTGRVVSCYYSGGKETENEMRTGNCFEDAGRRATDPFTNENWTLVHGLPFNPAIGMRMPHGWLEKDEIVLDTNSGKEIDKGLYYAMGKIEDTVRYTKTEARKMTVDTGHWGHWDEMFHEAEAAIKGLGY